MADRSGPDIIPVVVDYCKKRHGEEALILVPVVALPPRAKTLAVLHAMEHSPNAADRGFAQEFLTEFEMSDTKAAAKRCSRFSRPRNAAGTVDRQPRHSVAVSAPPGSRRERTRTKRVTA